MKRMKRRKYRKLVKKLQRKKKARNKSLGTHIGFHFKSSHPRSKIRVSKKCCFCRNPLDNSDEHIIPSCLKGRLHSKDLICSECNSKKFGAKLEPVTKTIFNPLLLILNLENAKSVHTKDPDGKEYLLSKKGNVSVVRPELSEVKRDGKTFINVTGDKKNAIKFFEKKALDLLKKGYKPLSYSVDEISEPVPPLSFEWKFEIIPEIILQLNKIAVEFYIYSGLNLNYIKHIAERVNALDKKLKNVIFCNWSGEIRETKPEEISHLIVIRRNKNGTLYCYIELFNVLCAYIQLYDNCKDEIDFIYHQDVITGERFTEQVELNLDREPKDVNGEESFEILTNNMFQRIKERKFKAIYTGTFKEIMDDAEKEVREGKLDKQKLVEMSIKRCCEAIAYLTVYEYPYLTDDFKDEENPEMNYIHSNLQEGQFEEFCELNQSLIGISVDLDNGNEYIMENFLKTPFIIRNGITLVKVFCVLRSKTTSKKKYIPYREFFEGLQPNKDGQSKLD
jgi:5-methylcytosine-specific restriction endonuclease McrA